MSSSSQHRSATESFFLRRLEQAGSTPIAGTKIPASANLPKPQYDARWGQVIDEDNHVDSTNRNRQELLQAKLNSLKTQLVEKIEQDDWMYEELKP